MSECGVKRDRVYLWKGDIGETPSHSFCMLCDVEGQISTENGESQVAGRVDALNK